MRTASLICILGLGLTGCQSEPQAEFDRRPVVRAETLQYSQVTEQLVFSGTLQPVQQAQLAFQSSGIVETRPAKIGQQVVRGDVMATLRNPELAPAEEAARARLDQAITERDQAQRDLSRLRELVKTGAVGEERVEQTESRYRSLQLAVQQAQASLAASRDSFNDARLSAPFSGEVIQVFAEPGEFVAAGQTVVSVGAGDALEVLIRVPATVVGHIQLQQQLPLSFPQAGVSGVAGTVTELAHIGSSADGLFPVVVEYRADAALERGDIRAGLHAEVSVSWSVGPGWLVPLTAISDPLGQDSGVYVLNQGQARFQPIQVLAQSGGQVLVAGEFAEGQQVIVGGHHLISDGVAVRTQ